MEPQIIKTKDAHKYVGGRLIWEELKKLYPDILIPFRRTSSRGDESYRVAVIDQTLSVAQAEQSLLN